MQFAIVEFLDEDETIEIVPCKWIKVDYELQKCICLWPGSTSATKYAMTQKDLLISWGKSYYIPRKFCGLQILLIYYIIPIYFM